MVAGVPGATVPAGTASSLTFSDELDEVLHRLVQPDSVEDHRPEVPMLEGADQADGDHRLLGHDPKWLASAAVSLACAASTPCSATTVYVLRENGAAERDSSAQTRPIDDRVTMRTENTSDICFNLRLV